jgi:hypothetical protein
VQTAPTVFETTLVDFGDAVVAADPQPHSHFVVPFTSLRAPPSVAL